MKKTQGFSSFTFPKYGRGSLAEIPATILYLFGANDNRPLLEKKLWERIDGCEKIILFFVDGMGYDHVFKNRKQFAFFEKLWSQDAVHPITTIFPATTAAGMTTIHSGLTPQEHGLPEWNVYFEELGMVIETIPFKPYKTKTSDSLMKTGGKPQMLYDGPTIYEKLGDAGVQSFIFNKKDYAESAFAKATHRGGEIIPYFQGSDLFVRLRKMLNEVKGKAYFFVYWDQIDSVEHKFGPGSEEHTAELSYFCHMMDCEFLEKLDRENAGNAALLMSADHGQINARLENLFYLDDYIDLKNYLAKNKNGEMIIPTGSIRDVFLFIEPQKRDEAITILKKTLKNIAETLSTETAIANGLFGINSPSERFLRRIGNVLILPYKHNLLWSRSYKKDPAKVAGVHGGLSKEEMIIPFAAIPISELIKK